MKKLTKIRTTGTVSVEHVDPIPAGSKYTILIVGQTGAGKSSFIETLSTDKSLGIAKNQLDSVTQSVVGYKLVNVERNLSGHNFVPMYIVDTPGFSDPRISEMKIIKMILQFTAENNINTYSRILFFDRITDPRMTGSKGRNLEIFKALTGEQSAKRITIITTMWDQLWREDQMDKAQKRFDQLKDGFWEAFVKQGARLVKFENNQESTLELLDTWLSGYRGEKFGFEDMAMKQQDLRSTPFAGPLYETLVERISGVKLKLQSVERDLEQEDTKRDPELQAYFSKSKADAESQIAELEEELLDFGLLVSDVPVHKPPKHSSQDSTSDPAMALDTLSAVVIPVPDIKPTRSIAGADESKHRAMDDRPPSAMQVSELSTAGTQLELTRTPDLLMPENGRPIPTTLSQTVPVQFKHPSKDRPRGRVKHTFAAIKRFFGGKRRSTH